MVFKTQLICCIIVFFIGVFYFVSVKEKKKKSHKWYSVMLIVSVAQLVFDILSVITVNQLETIEPWINKLVHQCFMTLMLAIFFAVYRYLETVIQEEIGDAFKSAKWAYIPLLVSFVGVLVLPIYYAETPKGNYSYGPGPINIYISIAIYVILIIRLTIKYGRMLPAKKTTAIVVAMLSEALIAGYQAFVPTALISCLGITLLNLSFYLMMENPDAVLVELLKKETHRADVANRAKTDFLANMSHEIRTPINSMLGMTEVILREKDEKKIKEYAMDIQDSTKSLLNLINDILDISKIEAGKMVITDVEYSFSAMIEEVLNMVNYRIKDRNLRFDVDIDGDIPDKLVGDDVHIRQVLVNLLSNAFKYTAEGSVSLNVRLIPESNEKEACLWFSVKDTGMGIKKEDMDRIMIPYERFDVTKNRNIEGSGLGLPITFKLLAGMGSKMRVESEYGKGSEFSFILKQQVVNATPISKIKKDKEEEKTYTYVPAFEAPDAKVLVVDDNKMNRKVFRALLKKTKIQIDEACSGKECLEMVQKRAYDIIFMDHMMPEMDGVETYHILKEMKDYPSQKAPVVIVTANAIKGAKDKYIVKEGFRAYISKPIDYVKLEKTIKALLKKNLIHGVSAEDETTEEAQEELPVINGLDWEYAKNHFTEQQDMLQAVAFFCGSIDSEAKELQLLYEKLDEAEGYKNYCTKVHSMKNSAAIVGIIPLTGMAKVLEDAARREERSTLDVLTPVFLKEWTSFKERLADMVSSDAQDRQQMSESNWNMFKGEIRKAAEDMDIDALDKILFDMQAYRVPEEYEEAYLKIQDAIGRFDVEYLMTI
ncbi:MAG: response regulator [Lachnospiraceae bacterium]|nr:response regulator [Lachnospiraceae bacterium]